MELDNRMVSAEWLKNKFYEICDEYNSSVIFIDRIIDEIDDAPDVEVIRCKDCKHYVLHALACLHENFNGIIPMNGYCYFGERKDND